MTSLKLWLPLSLLVGSALGLDLSWSPASRWTERAPQLDSSEEALPPGTLSPRGLENLHSGERLLDEALRTKRWGDSQAEALRRLLPGLPVVQQHLLTQRLIVSMERGKLSVETTGLPF